MPKNVSQNPTHPIFSLPLHAYSHPPGTRPNVNPVSIIDGFSVEDVTKAQVFLLCELISDEFGRIQMLVGISGEDS